MALTRAQLLMGNDSQGAVLSGEVQAVKQGAGIFIDTDGTISVDASSVVGLVKLNSGSAFNGYVWPNAKGAQGQFLTMGAGNALTWTNGGVFVSGSAPLNPEIGDLWFDCTTGQLLVYEACTSGAPKWTSGSEGLPVLPGDTTASPAFVSGSGTLLDPYICSASSASVSGTIVVNRVTITDLAPFQFVPIIDLNAVVNGGRFSVSNNVANASGILIFDLLFNDSPTSTVGTVYTCALKVGYGSVYINAPVTLTDVFVLNSPGSISGGTQIGQTLTYTVGTAAGGALPYTPSWVWRLFSDGSTLQTGGNTYVTTASELGDSVYVTLTIEDNEGQIVTGSTADYGPISKPPFPNPTPPTVPTAVGVTSTFTWDGANTTLESDGCLLFSVGAGPFTQGPTPVVTGNTVSTKWSDAAPNVCANAVTGTFIEGCLFDANFSSCGSVLIDRIPNAFTILPSTPVAPGAVATSFPVTIVGNNAPGFITVGASSDGVTGSYQASINGGSFTTVPPAGTYSLSILPGQSLAVRFTTGPLATTTYKFNVQIGDSTNSVNANFLATTTNSNFPTTPITFPTTTSGTGSVGTSVAWGNGTTNITGTGCIEFSLNGISYTQTSTQIVDGDILRTRFIASGSCANNTNGQTITGAVGNGTFEESTSLTIDRVPNGVTFNLESGATVSTQYTSNVTTPTGYNSTGYVTLAAGATLTSVQANVNNTGFVAVPASGATTMPIEPGQTLQIRATTGGSFSTNYTATIELGVSGSVSTSSWTVEVGAAVPAVATPMIVTPSDGATGVGTAAGITLTSSTYSASGGAGTHASSSWEVYAANLLNPETSAIISSSSAPTYTYQLDRSVRFVNTLQTYLSRTFASGGNRRTWTFACWFKKGATGNTPILTQGLFVGGGVATDQANFTLDNGSSKISYTDTIASSTVCNLVTTDDFLDSINWHHLVLRVDTTQTVSVNRVRLYVDGVQITSFGTQIYYPLNQITSMNAANPLNIGVNGIPITNYLSSCLAGVYFIDGQSLAPTSFGEFSGSRWIPIDYTGTFGSNGFELLFGTDTSTIPSSVSVGKDTSGNSNNFRPVSLYTGSSLDTSFVWASATGLPSSYTFLGVGRGGSVNTGTGNYYGGGGGGVIQGTVSSLTVGTNYTPQFTNVSGNIGNVTFMSQTAGEGLQGSFFGPGGTSGGPQMNAGGFNSNGRGGGGGGAGGAAGTGAFGPGITSSIRGSSESYGEGGSSGDDRFPVTLSNQGKGLPGSQSGGFVMAMASTSTSPFFGAFWPSGSVTSGVFSNTITDPAIINNAYAQWNPDSPTRGTQVDTGVGGVVVGNYATLNPRQLFFTRVTLSNSNLNYNATGPGGGSTVNATLLISKGLYYWEIEPVTPTSTITGSWGISANGGTNTYPGFFATAYCMNASGQKVNNAVTSPYGTAFGAGDVAGIAFNADTGELYFARNNVWQNSGNPVTSVNPAYSDLTIGPFYVQFGGVGQGAVNFGQRPFRYTAPTGYKCLIENPTETTLEFGSSTGLSEFIAGDLAQETGGDASGTVVSVNTTTNELVLSNSSGTWTNGSTVTDTSRTVPAPYPTTEPPDPLLYSLIASATNSVTNLTSFPVAKPPLDPLLTYYARVQYKSNTVITTSAYSAFSKFVTGSL